MLVTRANGTAPSGSGTLRCGGITMTAHAQVHTRALQRERRVTPRPDDFLSIACHELRNPLSLLLLHAEVAARRLEGHELPAAIRDPLKESVARMQETTCHLARLCETLLDVRALEAGKRALHSELVDVATLARGVLDRYRPICERARCEATLFAEGTTTAFLDPVRIEQILVNLLLNACKHASSAQVEIGIRGQQDEIVVEVTDQGGGIRPEDLLQLGDSFAHLSGPHDPDSVGLGLYICASLVEQMGGQLRCESDLGAGASFIVRLPRRVERFGEDDAQLHLTL